MAGDWVVRDDNIARVGAYYRWVVPRSDLGQLGTEAVADSLLPFFAEPQAADHIMGGAAVGSYCTASPGINGTAAMELVFGPFLLAGERVLPVGGLVEQRSVAGYT